ncbi:MAG: pyrroline-5-carboxylate reductase [Parasphingorhabdus sp.]|nr:pyrroline-5-carboxylate reductase [Parasphingorhabdus sp.]
MPPDALSSHWPSSIWLLGCGNMGGAIAARWLDSGMTPDRLTIIDPAPSRLPSGMIAHHVPPSGANPPQLLLLAIKPQMLNSAVPALSNFVGADTVLVSILAGTELATLAALFPQARAIVRLMPNMAVAVGKSPMILVSADADAELRSALDQLFAAHGPSEWLENETLMDIATALSGSGPAFVYRYIDALAKGGAALGLLRAQADRLALMMVAGAAELAVIADDDPATLANRVASPGGVTRAGLNMLDEGAALDNLVTATLDAAAKRNAEMAAEAKREG